MKIDKILILDFGSQYTQLIARRVRELRVYSVIEPCTISLERIKEINPKGIILSGGPHSVYEKNAPCFNKEIFELGIAVLGICYGMQIMVKTLGGKVAESKQREYGRAQMYIDDHDGIFFSLPASIVSWMSHTDKVTVLPKGFAQSAHTLNTKYASICDPKRKLFAVQFHPEVVHTEHGLQILSNFLFRVADCFANWQLGDFIQEQIREIRKKVGNSNVICGLSGGVDSTTAAVLISKAIGKKLKCIFVNNGVLRKGEAVQVLKICRDKLKLNVVYADATNSFLSKLKAVTDPEVKRKIIGHEFINVFDQEASKIKDVKFLVQGTLYPDVIESISFFGGPTATIKSHHNVGGLPKDMKLSLIEPFRQLFKDEVREIANLMDMPQEIVGRHPFPGPGLAIRIIGEVTRERLRILRDADLIRENNPKTRPLRRDLAVFLCLAAFENGRCYGR